MLTGFCISAFIGIILGLLMGYSTNIYDIFEFLVDFFRSIPGLALFPLFMLVLGIGDKARIGVVVFACSLVVLINTMYGVLNAKKIRIRAAKIMGADKITLFRKVIFWEALPSISSGLRISLSMALLITIVTEMFIGTKYGLGQRIFNSHLVYRIPDMYSSIILTGFLGYGLNKVYMYFERKIVHWTGK
jgi:NitT/TauT family transport system permease protein